VRFAANFAGIDETFLVVNGDVLTDLDVSASSPSTATSRRRARSRSTGADPSAFGVVRPTRRAG